MKVVRQTTRFIPWLSLAFLVACGCGADPERITAVEGLAGDDASGLTLYNDNCQRCHGTAGVGGRDGNINGTPAEQTIEDMLAGPEDMPVFDDLTDQELADIAAYVQSL